MRTLVIVAHPDLSHSRVSHAWTDAIRANERATVRVLTETATPTGFDVAAEQQSLELHDRIVLQFPFHWYNCPPILKTWLDQVLERGWAYGPGGNALEGKELSIAVSTWSTADDYTRDGRYGHTMAELTSPFEVTALRVGMRYRPGFFLNGVGHLTDEQLTQTATNLIRWINER